MNKFKIRLCILNLKFLLMKPNRELNSTSKTTSPNYAPDRELFINRDSETLKISCSSSIWQVAVSLIRFVC